MADSLYETRLQGIMVVVFSKTCERLGNVEYNYHDPADASHRGDWPNLVPRGHNPSGLRQGSGPLGYFESPPKGRPNLIGC